MAGIDQLRDRGAEGIVFGCTKISLLLSQSDFDVPTFDTTEIHVTAALDFAFSKVECIAGAL
jgi:aspartate racemase